MIDTRIRILVTGGSGFIGMNTIDYLLDKNIETTNFDIKPPQKEDHLRLWEEVDIRDFDLLLEAGKNFNPTHIIHLAAVTGMDVKDMSTFSANTDGVKNLIKCAEITSFVERIVFASSLLVCRNGYIPQNETDYCPPNLYGESKMIGEKIVREHNSHNFTWSIVRPTSIWGPWFEHSYKSFFKMIDKNYYLHPGKKVVTKPASYVGNTIQMMFKILFGAQKEVEGQTFYLTDYPAYSTKDWAITIQKCLNVKKIKTAPIWLLRLFSSVGDTLKFLGYSDPPLTNFRLNNILTGGSYPVENTRGVCGDLPYDLETSVRITARWLYDVGGISNQPD